MTLEFNGVEPQNVTFNGAQVQELQFNGVTVWTSVWSSTITVGEGDIFGGSDLGHSTLTNTLIPNGDLSVKAFGEYFVNEVRSTESDSFTSQDSVVFGVIEGNSSGQRPEDADAVLLTRLDTGAFIRLNWAANRFFFDYGDLGPICLFTRDDIGDDVGITIELIHD